MTGTSSRHGITLRRYRTRLFRHQRRSLESMTDLVENDGEYLYVLDGSRLIVVHAWPTDELAEVARLQLDSTRKACICTRSAGQSFSRPLSSIIVERRRDRQAASQRSGINVALASDGTSFSSSRTAASSQPCRLTLLQYNAISVCDLTSRTTAPLSRFSTSALRPIRNSSGRRPSMHATRTRDRSTALCNF